MTSFGKERHGGTERDEISIEHEKWNDLSPIERTILEGLCLGRTNGEICAQLRLSERALKLHIRHGLLHLGALSRHDLFTLIPRPARNEG